MALTDKAAVVVSLRVLVTVLVTVFVFLLSKVGGVLNRCRGGYLDFDKILPGNDSDAGVYWARHVLSRAVFALPTALLVILTGLHLRAGGIVAILTLFSLFVGWGSYMNIGFEHCNYKSREGAFDWLLGRQELHWKFQQRFIREFSGMSLRGLVWTAPQGYALQQMGFGWQYSLVGSLMGFVYYLGGATARIISSRSRFFDGNIGFSEFYWGTWIWFVLLVSCLSQLVYRLRKWVYARSTCTISNPHGQFQVIKYGSLNRFIVRLWYEATMVILLVLFAATVMFYSLIIQPDIRNKAQTFFGLFTGVMALTIFMGWVWGQAYLKWQIGRARKVQASREHSSVRQARSPPQIKDIDRLGGGGFLAYSGGETDPLLPWPYSHPDKGLADSRASPHYYQDGSRSSTPPVGYGSHVQAPPRSYHHRPTSQLSSVELAFVILWPNIEKWVWLDIFVLLRHLIGVLSLLSTLAVLFMTTVSVVWDIDSPRFDPQYTVLNNSSVWPFNKSC